MFLVWIRNKVEAVTWGGRKFHTFLKQKTAKYFRFPRCQTEENAVFLDHRPRANKLIIWECKSAGFEDEKYASTRESPNTLSRWSGLFISLQMQHQVSSIRSGDERLQRLIRSWRPQNVPAVSSCRSEDLAPITAFRWEALWQLLRLAGSEHSVNDNNGARLESGLDSEQIRLVFIYVWIAAWFVGQHVIVHTWGWLQIYAAGSCSLLKIGNAFNTWVFFFHLSQTFFF